MRVEVPTEMDDEMTQEVAEPTFGKPEAELTHVVDASAVIERKRASMMAHASQISDSSFFLQMPDEVFATMFGTEWFIHRGAPKGIHQDWLAGLD